MNVNAWEDDDGREEEEVCVWILCIFSKELMRNGQNDDVLG
jgi:hypothetical protein